jgi:hypothetical protein
MHVPSEAKLLLQLFDAQSRSAAQALPAPHAAQMPPQSTSLSKPSRTRSVQLAAPHEPS